jgi:hypothetical protein
MGSIRAKDPALYDRIYGNVAGRWMNSDDDYSKVYYAVFYFLGFGGGDPLFSLQSGQGQDIKNDYQRGHDTFQDSPYSNYPAAPFWYMVFSAVQDSYGITPQNLPEDMSQWYQKYGPAFGEARDNWRRYQDGGEFYDALKAGFALVHAAYDYIHNTPNVIHPQRGLAIFRYAFSQLTSIYITQVWVHVGQ